MVDSDAQFETFEDVMLGPKPLLTNSQRAG